jgi:hypothetical protein
MRLTCSVKGGQNLDLSELINPAYLGAVIAVAKGADDSQTPNASSSNHTLQPLTSPRKQHK